MKLSDYQEDIQYMISVLYDTKIKVGYASRTKINDKLDAIIDKAYYPNYDLMAGDVLLDYTYYSVLHLDSISLFATISDDPISKLIEYSLKLNITYQYIKNRFPKFIKYVDSLFELYFNELYSKTKYYTVDRISDLKKYGIDLFSKFNGVESLYFDILSNDIYKNNIIGSDLIAFLPPSGTSLLEYIESGYFDVIQNEIRAYYNSSNELDLSNIETEILEKLQNIMNKQYTFIKLNRKKKALNKKQYNSIKHYASNVKSYELKSDLYGTALVSYFKLSDIDVDGDMRTTFEHNSNNLTYNNYIIQDGIDKGKRLLDVLSYVDDSKLEISKNKRSGQLDYSKIHQLAYANRDDYFQTSHRTGKRHRNIILNIDMSKSIQSEYKYVLEFIVSIIYAIYHTEMLDMEVYIRQSTLINNGTKKADIMVMPLLVKIFDTKENSIDDIYNLKYLKPLGGSPEGIIYQHMIENNMLSDVDDFITISDGAPYFMNNLITYTDTVAETHTHKYINMIYDICNVLPYSINSATENKFKELFDGRGSIIKTSNIHSISEELSKLWINR